MPGMSKSSRVVRLIEASFDALEHDPNASALDAILLLDELRRLERKWRGQVEAGSPRRIESDFHTLEGWYRRWVIASTRVLERGGDATLQHAIGQVEESLRKT